MSAGAHSPKGQSITGLRARRVAVLGCTGSIGVSTLDVMARHPQRYEVFALSAARQVDLMFEQCLRFAPRIAVMVEVEAAQDLARRLKQVHSKVEVLAGAAALDEVAAHADVDTVMAAIVGAAGLSSCMAAARAGKRLLLANKEALVLGGQLFLDAVQAGQASLLPIDSEHSAVFQSLPDARGTWAGTIDKIILTASGGPFRTWAPERLGSVTPQQACAHPNWSMGQKISVDSATMMNKALEVIEARYLFGVAPEQVEVVIHPQSIVHSMVQYRDASVVAQLGTPDMRGPIAYGLSWPERIVSGAAPLNFSKLPAMTFESIHEHDHPQRFPGLALAWETLRAPMGTCAVLNAANEVAVAAFLQQRIAFTDIHRINRSTLDRARFDRPGSVGDLLELDRQARAWAQAETMHLAQ